MTVTGVSVLVLLHFLQTSFEIRTLLLEIEETLYETLYLNAKQRIKR